ncbi:MAG TPA: NADPH-dependent F420 reductase [Anaeromyxobacter sp.]|nr:NADPH-dependent F420 reductase [Anaeromyxobacter sp.]
MRIGILGTGQIGGTAARLFASAGHEVALAHRGGPESLRAQVAALGPKARAATVDEAIGFGEVILLAIPWRSRGELPAERLRGKIAIDAMNPYRPDFSLYDLGDSTSSEEVARTFPGARIVKALNHLKANDLARRGRPEEMFERRTALFVAGDDPEAKRTVAGLVAQLGFAPVDTGGLRDGGKLQGAGGPLYIHLFAGAEAEGMVHGLRAGAPAGSEQPRAG